MLYGLSPPRSLSYFLSFTITEDTNYASLIARAHPYGAHLLLVLPVKYEIKHRTNSPFGLSHWGGKSRQILFLGLVLFSDVDGPSEEERDWITRTGHETGRTRKGIQEAT